MATKPPIADLRTKPPTLKSLAEVTGLGISTVSQALRDSPEISADTKRRVQLAAAQAGYRPNRAGVRLRTGRTNVICLILNTDGAAMGLIEQMVFGISEVLSGTAYHLVVTPYALSDPMAPVHYVVENRLADGVIISRTLPDDPRVRYLSAHNMPFATHGRTSIGLSHPYYDFDNEVFASHAVAAVAERGRRRIALLGPPPGLSFHGHTLSGFAAGLRAAGIDECSLQDIHLDTEIETVRRRAELLAGQVSERPDGIVSSSELMTMALIAGLEDGGMVLGRDFDLVSKQSSPFMAWFRPGLILINEDHRVAGRELARAVLGSIGGEATAKLQTLARPAQPSGQ